jgi:hypothetical protein
MELMVRATLVAVGIGLFVGATACSGRSTNDDDSSAGASGDAGASSGGSASGGTGGASGTTTGGSGSGDDDDVPTGGTTTGGSASGGSSGTFPTGGTSPTGGAATGGSAGSNTGGLAGEGGSAGEPSDCEGPAPGGCQFSGCPSGQTCTLASGACIPSRCDCVNGEWSCTRDCNGGFCADGPSSCATPDPSGCETNDDCAAGKVCAQPAIAVCIPTGCACGFGSWQCREDCGGGVCTEPTCPAGCEAQPRGLCGEDEVTWVCTTSPIPVEEFMNGGCVDQFTQVPRYCCPSTFKPECQ